MKRAFAALSVLWLVLASSLAFGQTPSLVQSFTTEAQPPGTGGDTGNGFKVYLPNPVGSGNLLLLEVSYPSGNTVSTIADVTNGSWSTTAAVTASDGQITSIYLFPNSASGGTTQDAVTITFSASIAPVKLRFQEWTNIATSSVSAGTTSAINQSGATVSCGSFTPSVSNTMIVAFYDLDGNNAGSNSTGFTAGTSFTLHDAAIGWVSDQGYPSASQYFNQTSAAAINPGITTGDSTDSFNCVAIALKAASAGTAPGSGIRVVKVVEQSSNATANGNWKLQFPNIGNLLVGGAAAGFAITGVTDNLSNTWTNETTANTENQLFFLQNATASSTRLVTLAGTAFNGGGTFFLFYDIVNAATTGQPGSVASTALTTADNVTSVANQPSITPGASGSLIIAMLNNQMGPTTAVTVPSGAFWDGVNYAGKSDASQMDWGNGWGHFTTTSTSAESWTWTIMTRASNSVGGLAVEFKTAPASSGCPPPSLALLGVGC